MTPIDPPAAEVSLATFALAPPPRRRTAFVTAVMGALVAVTVAGVAQSVDVMTIGVAWVVVGILAAVAIRRRSTGAPPPVVVTSTRLLVPASPSGGRLRAIPLDDIRAIEEHGRSARRLVVVDRYDRVAFLPIAAFVEPDGPARLRHVVREAMAARPGGPERVARMAAREAEGDGLAAFRPRATMALVAVVGVVFGLELATGALDDTQMLLALGASAGALVRRGQWWRLVTANLLHLSFIHIYFNAGALMSFGTMLERLVGSARFLVAALLAGIVGGLTSIAAGRHGIAAGASGIAFGLMGALLCVNLLHRRHLPPGYAIGTRQWLVLLGINGAISLLPMIDGMAHLGGLVGGVLATLALAWRLDMTSRLRSIARVLAAALVLVYVAGIGAAAIHFATDADEDFAALVDTSRFDADELNYFAWEVATARRSSPRLLAHAEDAARRAVARRPKDGNVRDTLAYVVHRLGRRDEALRIEREAAWLTPLPDTFGMLHRFLREARIPESRRRASITRAGDDVVVVADAGAVVYAATRDGSATGLLRVVLPADTATGRAPAPPSLGPGATFEVLLVDDAAARPERPSAKTQIEHQPLAPGVAKLP
jgi:rhomboid protease GluP